MYSIVSLTTKHILELIYALEANGDFNKGTATLKEIAGYFENVFSIDIGDLYPLAELSQCILDSSNGSIINVI